VQGVNFIRRFQSRQNTPSGSHMRQHPHSYFKTIAACGYTAGSSGPHKEHKCRCGGVLLVPLSQTRVLSPGEKKQRLIPFEGKKQRIARISSGVHPHCDLSSPTCYLSPDHTYSMATASFPLVTLDALGRHLSKLRVSASFRCHVLL
jgi:hypothetical protein